MRPANPDANPDQGSFELFGAPSLHYLLLKVTYHPTCVDSSSIPLLKMYLKFLVVVFKKYKTKYEDVADFLAEYFESGSEEWIGMGVGMKDMSEIKAP